MKELDHNIINPVDILLEKNPDLTEQEAIDILNKNKVLNEEYMKQEVANAVSTILEQPQTQPTGSIPVE